MASRQSLRLLRTLPHPRAARTPRFYSTGAEDAPPPFLSTLKSELKTAMRAKDTPRLAVLRAIMSANLNASKTKQPFRNDAQLVQAIAKMRRVAEESAAQAAQANRQDLVDKSMDEARLLAEYEKSSGVETVSVQDLEPLIKQAVDKAVAEGVQKKALVSEVIKTVKAACEGKILDNKEMSTAVRNMVQ